MSSQPEPRRRSLRIIESRRKILRDAIRDIVHEYKRAQRRQRWRDAIWDIIQQKRAKQARPKRMVRKMAEQRRAQKAAELRARIRERQEDRRCMVCLSYHGWTLSYDGLVCIVDTPYTVCDGFFRMCNMNLDFSNGNVSSRAPVSVVIQICRTWKEVLRNFMYIRCCDTTKPPSPGISAWYRLYLLLSLLTCCGTIKPQLMSTCLYTFSGMYRVDHGVCNVNTQIS